MSGPGSIGNRTNTADLDRLLGGTGFAAKPTVAAQTGALGNRTVAVGPAPQPRAAEPGFFGKLWISIKNFFGVGQGTPVVVAPAPQRAPTTANPTAPQPTGPQTLGGNQAVVKKPPVLFSAVDPGVKKESLNSALANLYQPGIHGDRLATLINKESAHVEYPSKQHLTARNFQPNSLRESTNPVFSKINDLVMLMVPPDTTRNQFQKWSTDNADRIRHTIENEMGNIIKDIVKDTEDKTTQGAIGSEEKPIDVEKDMMDRINTMFPEISAETANKVEKGLKLATINGRAQADAYFKEFARAPDRHEQLMAGLSMAMDLLNNADGPEQKATAKAIITNLSGHISDPVKGKAPPKNAIAPETFIDRLGKQKLEESIELLGDALAPAGGSGEALEMDFNDAPQLSKGIGEDKNGVNEISKKRKYIDDKMELINNLKDQVAVAWRAYTQSTGDGEAKSVLLNEWQNLKNLEMKEMRNLGKGLDNVVEAKSERSQALWDKDYKTKFDNMTSEEKWKPKESK